MDPNLDKPLPDPEAKYDHPSAIVDDKGLSLAQKLKLLNAWEDDVRNRLVASEEGMTGPRNQVTLTDVLDAKNALPVDATRPETPSKA